MKQAILGSLVGIAIVIAIDSLVRVLISTYAGQDILMISYSAYGGVLWPILLTIIAGFSSFLGGLFGISYGREHKATTASLYVLLLVILRYGQIHLLISMENLFYPITALVLSLGGAFFAWQLAKSKKRNEPESETTDHYHQPPPGEG